MGGGIFTHHDGIIDDNSQCHNQREQAEHIDRAAKQIQQAEREQKGGGHSRRNPESHTAGQE